MTQANSAVNPARPATKHSEATLGAIFVLLSAVGFASKAIFVKLSYRYGVDAITLLALRMICALGFFLVFAVFSRKDKTLRPLTQRDWLALAGLGLIGYYASSLLDFLGLLYITAALERLILFLYPTLVVLLSALLLRQSISRPVLLAMLVSYAGIGLVFVDDLHSVQKNLWLGSCLVFGSALTYSVYLIGSGRLIAGIGSQRFTTWVMLVSSIAVLLQFAVMRPISALNLPWQVLCYGAAMGLLSTVLPVYFLAAGIARIGSSRAALLSTAGPVITIVLGVVFLGERLGPLQVAGAALVIVGVWLISRVKR